MPGPVKSKTKLDVKRKDLSRPEFFFKNPYPNPNRYIVGGKYNL